MQTEVYAHASYPLYTEPQYTLALKIISLALIIFTGILGNSVVVYTIIRDKRLHRPPFYYLVSLSMSDLARSVFCLPFVLTTVIQGYVWVYGENVCTLLAFTNTFFIYSSAITFLLIAADRYIGVVRTRFYRRKCGGLISLAFIVFGWGVAFLVSFPPIFGLGSYTFVPDEAQCTYAHKNYRTNDTLIFVMVFTLMMGLSLFLYYRILIFLRNHRKMHPFFHQPARSNNWTFFGPGANGQALVNWLNGFTGFRQNPWLNPIAAGFQMPPRQLGRTVNLKVVKDEHLSRLFFLVNIIFDGLWIPYLVLSYWQIFATSKKLSPTFVSVAAWCSYLSVAINPLVYLCYSGTLRRAFRPSVNAYSKRDSVRE